MLTMRTRTKQFQRDVYSVVAGAAALLLTALQPAYTDEYLGDAFPNAYQMRQISGWGSDPYEISHPSSDQRHYRTNKCAPQFALKAIRGEAMGYPLKVRGKPYYEQFINMSVFMYADSTTARQVVNTYRGQMSHCHHYKLTYKKAKQGFPIRTTGVRGGPGEARMRHHHWAGRVPHYSQREWLTARDSFVVLLRVANLGVTQPPFPRRQVLRELTSFALNGLPLDAT